MSAVQSGNRHLLADEKLAKIIKAIELEDIQPSYDVYEGLLSAIVSQQLSVKAAATIYGRFLDLFAGKYPHVEQLKSMTAEDLRTAGLSRQKSQYVLNVVEYFERHALFTVDWSEYTDQQLIDLLTSIKGVGRWTVEMILMFTLDRRDVLPLNDLGIQQAMVEIYGLVGNKRELASQMIAVGEGWSPHRSLACRYLWASKK